MRKVPLYIRMMWIRGGGYRKVLLGIILDEALLIQDQNLTKPPSIVNFQAIVNLNPRDCPRENSSEH